MPPSTVPGEAAWPTQPVPTKPPAFDRQGVTEDDLIDFTPELRQQALEYVKPYVLGPLYTPPSIRSDESEGKKGTLTIPGAWGAGNWHTGAFDPETGMYYAVSLTLPGVRAVTSTKGNSTATMDYGSPGPSQQTNAPDFVAGLGPQVHGLPIVKPPYGRITAFNLNSGDQVWMVANGDGPRDHPLLKDLRLPPLGVPNRPAPLVTKTLLFIGEGSDAVIGTPQVAWGWGKKFRAYDKATGQVVWKTELSVIAVVRPRQPINGMARRCRTSCTARCASSIAASVCGLAAASELAIVINPNGCRAFTHGRSFVEVYTHSSGS